MFGQNAQQRNPIVPQEYPGDPRRVTARLRFAPGRERKTCLRKMVLQSCVPAARVCSSRGDDRGVGGAQRRVIVNGASFCFSEMKHEKPVEDNDSQTCRRWRNHFQTRFSNVLFFCKAHRTATPLHCEKPNAQFCAVGETQLTRALEGDSFGCVLERPPIVETLRRWSHERSGVQKEAQRCMYTRVAREGVR